MMSFDDLKGMDGDSAFAMFDVMGADFGADARRQGEIFGSATPNRFSRKRSTDVWSKSSEFTHPPRVQGEITIMGTRGPRPTGSP